ncbi:MAG: alpha/beta fold hydrolase [Spirochaetota bacterium]
MQQAVKRYVQVGDIKICYYEYGQEGEPVLLLHGWPTSAFLYRKIAPQIAHNKRVIAIDLPGFGGSDKRTDITYSFQFFSKIINGFLLELGIDKISLVVHDLGGPVGLYWACNHMQSVSKLVILNTLVYPEMSWAVKLFLLIVKAPFVNSLFVSPFALRLAMMLGIVDSNKYTEEMFQGVLAPFVTDSDRQALLQAGGDLQVRGLFVIAQKISNFHIPVRIIYGEEDRILPDIAETVQRLKSDLPQAEVTVLKRCGHFLQEDQPEVLGKLLKEFLTD